jgi:lipopolysaccharide transport system ATP-binding protein
MTHAEQPVLSVQHLIKEYRLYDTPGARLRSLIWGATGYKTQRVLDDVNFELYRGQCLGVVGNNGAGKSSLLKLVAGTLRPTRGVLARHGRVTAILELGAGFHPDFTGRDNLSFGGRLIGLSDSEIQSLAPSIIEFSELGEAIDRPVKSYSSGMVVRLAFALVTAIEPDVLIIDEALAVGDQHFQKKCIQRIEAFRQNGCTILFCSHSMYHVRSLCNRAIWLDSGKVRAFGLTEDVLSAYEAELPPTITQTARGAEIIPVAQQMAAHARSAEHPPQHTGTKAPALIEGTRARILTLDVGGLGDGDPPLLTQKDLVVTVDVQVADDEQPQIGVMLEQAKGAGITVVATHTDAVLPQRLGNGLWRARVRFNDLPLYSGEYVVSAFLFDHAGLVVYDEWLHHTYFRVVYASALPGLIRLPHTWE